MTDAYDKALEAVATMTTNTPAGLSADWQTTARKVAAFDDLLNAAIGFVDAHANDDSIRHIRLGDNHVAALKTLVDTIMKAQGGAA